MKYVILFIGFIDALSIGIFVPALPDLAKFFNVSAFMIALAISLYSLFSFLFAPILGQLADRFGRKPLLLISVFGSFLSALIMAITSNYGIFLLARVVNGITGGNISIIQSILFDISKNKEERAINLGYISMLFGLAFIIGPLFGAFLLNFGLKAIFYCMALLSFLEMLLIIFNLKETILEKNCKKIQINPLKSIFKYFSYPSVKYWLTSLFIATFASSMYQVMLPIFLNKNFGISGQLSGYILAVAGLLVIINQGILLKKFWLKYFSLKKLVIFINISIFSILSILGITNNFYLFLAFFSILVIFQGVFRPIYITEIMERIGKKETGQISGTISSLRGISTIFSPLIAGFLINYNINIFLFSAILMIFPLFLVGKLLNKF